MHFGGRLWYNALMQKLERQKPIAKGRATGGKLQAGLVFCLACCVALFALGSVVCDVTVFSESMGKDGRDYNFKKGQQKSFSFELTPEWKTYTAEVDKAATPIDRVMFKFFVSKDSVADFDDCVVTPVG